LSGIFKGAKGARSNNQGGAESCMSGFCATVAVALAVLPSGEIRCQRDKNRFNDRLLSSELN
jgi:hypothetical protein